MDRFYRVLFTVLAGLLLLLIASDLYFSVVHSRLFALAPVPTGLFIRHAGFFAILCLCFILTVLFLVIRKRMTRQDGIIRSIIRLYKLVFDGLATGIMVLDRYANVRYMNTAFCRFVGCVESDSMKLMHYSVLVDPVLQPVAEKIAQALESGENFTREYRVLLPDGIKCFKCDLNMVDDGKFGTISILTLTDLTREDAVRQKLSRQLVETSRHAQARDNFFANMSHEIRTPINAILGMAYFARKLSTDDKCSDYIQKIENASELLLGVVNDILDFSRMQDSKFALNKDSFNVQDLKKILLDLFSLKAQQKGLEFIVEFNCPDPLYVYGDQFRITQIFMNLIGNAIKFTSNGLVAVALNYEKVGSDIILRCSVRDTGCGLTEEESGRILNDFEQFSQVLVKQNEGTGLGLAICKRLVDLMGGVIWVDSTPGKGSSFHFVIMCNDPSAGQLSFSESLPRIRYRTGRALIVDSNEINSEIAATLLSTVRYIGVTAKSLEEAVSLCQSDSSGYYDAVIVDLDLVKDAELSLLEDLKEAIGDECILIAAISLDSEKRQAGALFGGFLHKPYNPEEIREAFPDFRM